MCAIKKPDKGDAVTVTDAEKENPHLSTRFFPLPFYISISSLSFLSKSQHPLIQYYPASQMYIKERCHLTGGLKSEFIMEGINDLFSEYKWWIEKIITLHTDLVGQLLKCLLVIITAWSLKWKLQDSVATWTLPSHPFTLWMECGRKGIRISALGEYSTQSPANLISPDKYTAWEAVMFTSAEWPCCHDSCKHLEAVCMIW